MYGRAGYAALPYADVRGQQSAAATHGIKRYSSLTGLGASGPFFHDALASILLLIAVLTP